MMPQATPQTADAASTPAAATRPDRIVLFDGICGLCSHTVDYLLRHDQGRLLTFAPLQGATAAELIPADVRDRMDTMVYYRRGQLHYRSAAAVAVLRDLGGLHAVLGTMLWIIPGPIRNLGYRIVSTLRYRLFGEHESCRLPTPEERSRFLD